MAQQNVEVRIVGKDQASSELLRVGNTLERMKVSVESNRAGFNKLDGALKESARNLVGLQGSAGQVTSALLSFAPQSIFITAAIAGVGLLVKTFIDLAEAQKKAEADTKAALQGYVDAWGDVKMQIRNVNIGQEFTELDVITEKIEKLKEEMRAYGDSIAVATENYNKLVAAERAMMPRSERAGLGLPQGTAQAAQTTVTDLAKKQAEANAEALRLQAQLVRDEISANIGLASTLRELGSLRRLDVVHQQELADALNVVRIYANNVNIAYAQRLRAVQFLNRIELEDAKKLADAEAERQALLKERQDAATRAAVDRIGAQRMANTGLNAQFNEMIDNLDLVKVGLDAVANRITTLPKANLDFSEQLQTIAQYAYGIADGFDVMTNAIMNGANGFKALEMGARAAVRNILRVFAQEQIAKGIASIGSALSAAAIGNAASAGLFYKSAAQHFAAAAAAGVAGGVIGGGSNRGGGGGGGFSNSNLGGAGSGGAPIFITITGGGILDMNNPETARAFVNALQTATNRRAVLTPVGR